MQGFGHIPIKHSPLSNERQRTIFAFPVQIVVETDLEVRDLRQFQIVQVALGSGEDDRDLLLDSERRVLLLLEQFHQAVSAMQLLLRGLVEVRTKLRECRQRSVLGEVEAQGAGDRFHRLDLRVAADAANRDADIDRRADVRVEQIGLQVDLPVRDRDHIGRDVGGHVACLGLDEGQRGQGSSAQLLVELGGTLQ